MIGEILLESPDVYTGSFVKYGSSRHGRCIVVVVGIRPTSCRLTVSDTIEHSADCIQNFLRDDSNVIVGSAFEVKESHAQIKPSVLSVSSKKDVLHYRTNPVPADSGYTYVYKDVTDNIVIVPSLPFRSNLCVDIEDDGKF